MISRRGGESRGFWPSTTRTIWYLRYTGGASDVLAHGATSLSHTTHEKGAKRARPPKVLGPEASRGFVTQRPLSVHSHVISARVPPGLGSLQVTRTGSARASSARRRACVADSDGHAACGLADVALHVRIHALSVHRGGGLRLTSWCSLGTVGRHGPRVRVALLTPLTHPTMLEFHKDKPVCHTSRAACARGQPIFAL